MATQTIFQDSFDDGVQNLLIKDGTGAISESGGNLVLVGTPGSNQDWWSTVARQGKLAYQGIPILYKFAKVYYETTLQSWTPNGTTCHPMFLLYQNDTNHYWIHLNNNGVGIGVYRVVNNVWTNTGSIGVVTAPIKLRFVWDIQNGTIGFQYDSGGGWTDIKAAESMQLSPTAVAFYLKTWSGAGGTLEFADVNIWAELTDQPPLANDPNDKRYVAGVQDEVTYPTLSGPTSHSEPVTGRGVWSTKGDLKWPLAGITDAVALEFFANERVFVTDGAIRDSDVTRVLEAQFNSTTIDPDGHNHFIGWDLGWVKVGNCEGEPWHTPTVDNFTGYGRDGWQYINGVQQAGGPHAPWATEGSNADRSSRVDFPVKFAIVETSKEIVIFDLDDFPTNVKMWMRFRYSTSTSYNLFGITTQRWQDCDVHNGLIVGVNRVGSSIDGRMFGLDFKETGTWWMVLLEDGNAWIRTNDITQRNSTSGWTTSGAPSIRLGGNQLNRVAITQNADGHVWIIYGHDANARMIRKWDWTPSGAFGDKSGKTCKGLCFDRKPQGYTKGWPTGNVFFAMDSVIFRAHKVEYEQGVLPADTRWHLRTAPLNRPSNYVDLLEAVLWMEPAPPYVLAATATGVWRIHQATMVAEKIWTIEGYNGVGVNGGDGEIILGNQPQIDTVKAITLETGSYVVIGCSYKGGHLAGSIVVVRTNDGAVLKTYQYPDIPTDGSKAVDVFTY